MKNPIRRFRPFQFVLLAIALSGCASAVDEEGTATPTEEATSSSSEELKSTAAVADADSADCDAAPAKAVGTTDPQQEYQSILQTASINVGGGLTNNTCTAVCNCCKRGNRFCCAHCRFCSGPIGVSGGGVLAP